MARQFIKINTRYKALKNSDMSTIDKSVMAKAQIWLDGAYDEETKLAIKQMIDSNPQELIESFYRDLEFGTGGLRGIMGVGSNRMNKYTVGAATQGFANYLKANFPGNDRIKVAIAFDSRNNSQYFAQVTADVFSANGIKVYLFDELRPTPELSFAIRHFGCQGGIVITASHNPKEYNGYKAYWDDGGQLISPHDKNVIAEVQKITDISDVKFKSNPELIEMIGEEVDKLYLANIKSLSLSPDSIQRQKALKIVYTPIHGTGAMLVPMALEAFGFENIYTVKEQMAADGNFPTVISPNPEESAALKMALSLADSVNADLVMATDPDADRVGIAIRKDGKLVLLNGNQAATLLIYYLLEKWRENGKLTGNEYIVKTIVTSEILFDIADKYEVEHFDVLTGFKYIADIIKELEGVKTFIGGGEESYGYLVGEFVRDKDAVSSCAMIAEVAAWAADKDVGLFDLLKNIYKEFGFYKEDLVSVVRKGKAGAEEIQKMMDGFRNSPPEILNNSKLVKVKDYLSGVEKDVVSGIEKKINLPKSNVLQFFTEDGSKISVRPSGTEPKIKFYFGLKASLPGVGEFEQVNDFLTQRIEQIKKDLGI
jgi:phosphoglucomutase